MATHSSSLLKTDQGCQRVATLESFCHLNATLSCSENLRLAWKVRDTIK